MKKRIKPDRHAIIDCGNENEAYLAYLAMFRYCFGKMTYMPQVFIEIVKRNSDHLSDRTLAEINIELTEEAERYERLYKSKPYSNYGMDCDREDWLAFHAWVKAEISRSKENSDE